MSTNTVYQVLGVFADQGFSVETPDDDILVLKHEEEFVGRFIQTGATSENIQEECAKHLAQHQFSGIKNCR